MSEPADFDWIGNLLPLIVVVLGALATYWATKGINRRQAEKEDARHWRDELISRTGNFAGARENAWRLMAEYQDTTGVTIPPSTDYLARKVQEMKSYKLAVAEMQNRGQELALVAPESVRQATREISLAIFKMERTNTANDRTKSDPLAIQTRALINQVRGIAGVPDFDAK
jgi:hypothetical protein